MNINLLHPTAFHEREFMSKEELEQYLERVQEMPLITRRILEVAEEAQEVLGNERTRELVYNMLDLILRMGERIHELEMLGCRHVLWDDSSALYKQHPPTGNDRGPRTK